MHKGCDSMHFAHSTKFLFILSSSSKIRRAFENQIYVEHIRTTATMGYKDIALTQRIFELFTYAAGEGRAENESKHLIHI